MKITSIEVKGQARIVTVQAKQGLDTEYKVQAFADNVCIASARQYGITESEYKAFISVVQYNADGYIGTIGDKNEYSNVLSRLFW